MALGLAGLVFVLNIGGVRGLLSGRAETSGVQSLAVLPMKNLSQDPDQDYFAEGITDALITELGRVGSLRVISSTSVGRYKKTEESLPQIAKELNVEMIVEGSVLRSGDRVRITAKLIHPSDERQLWGRTFERNVGDVLALQSEMAGDITQQIGVRLSEEAQLQLAKRRTVNPLAVDAYLKGVYSGDPEHFSTSDQDRSRFRPGLHEDRVGLFLRGPLRRYPAPGGLLENEGGGSQGPGERRHARGSPWLPGRGLAPQRPELGGGRERVQAGLSSSTRASPRSITSMPIT